MHPKSPSILLNCFLLTLPILAWNIIFSKQLPSAFQPEIFWEDVPVLVKYGENISRIFVFLLTLFMPIRFLSSSHLLGFLLYIFGTFIYFVSWLALIYFPDYQWSRSGYGFMAPAYTPVFWLFGIWLIGDTFVFPLPHGRWLFIAVSMVFLFFHNWHTWLVYCRIYL